LREEHRLRVFENRVMTIFGSESDEVTEEWRKLHNEELNDLYSSSTIVRVTKLRMRWAGHVARMGERRTVYRVLVIRNVSERDNLEGPGVDGSSGGWMWGLGLDWQWIGAGGGIL
jgi:hypothetical protein